MEALNKVVKQEFKEAEDLLNNGDFEKSFTFFKCITENPNTSDKDKADSYNMMGVLVLISPELDLEDETGIKYFVKSIESDEFNVGALLNIIETVGLDQSMHNNISLFEFAIGQINSIEYNLSKREKEMIEQKLKLKEEILRL